jgi:CheY-like chemotaxis protein
MIRVLIAEDNPVNRELLRELLNPQLYVVTEACDGQQALLMLESSRPDILLLDVGMPVLNGYELVRRIRSDPKLATLPVLATTAYAMLGDRDHILQAGFDGYLEKPIRPRALAAAMARLLPTQL